MPDAISPTWGFLMHPRLVTVVKQETCRPASYPESLHCFSRRAAAWVEGEGMTIFSFSTLRFMRRLRAGTEGRRKKWKVSITVTSQAQRTGRATFGDLPKPYPRAKRHASHEPSRNQLAKKREAYAGLPQVVLQTSGVDIRGLVTRTGHSKTLCSSNL